MDAAKSSSNQGLHIGLLQYDIQWENPLRNREIIEAILDNSNVDNLDLLFLPEMFNTGFSMNVQSISESMEGASVKWMADMAAKLDCIVIGSLIIENNKRYYNRLVWMRPSGSYEYYDKKHLFTLAKEDEYFTAGNERKVISFYKKGEEWKICPLVCYDLRFPVWSRNTELYDILVYVANFPSKRKYAWNQLLIARAIENQSYVIGVNRIGKDGKEIGYGGGSKFIRYDGEVLLDSGNSEGFFRIYIEKEGLKAYRRAYHFLADRDQFEIFS